MSKTIEVKKDEESGEYYLDFNDLMELFDEPELVDSYSIETRDDDSMVLEFFDKNNNKIFPSRK